MATSGQNSNKVLMPVGPMTDNFQEKINMCLKWILNDQPPNKPALVQASDELVLLYVGVYPELVESSTDFVSGGLIRNTEPWRRTDKKNRDLYISKESKKAERVLQGFTLLCRGKVEHVTTRVEWANDVHSMVAEVANEIGATHIVVGTDDAKTKSFRINPLKWKSGPTDPGPAHRLTLGSKVAALVHCTVYCISLTSGKLVSELKGEAPYPEDPLPRPGSAASSGMSLENPVDGEPSANPHSPVHHALLASRSLPRPVPHGANGYWPQSPPGSYLVPMPPPGYYNQYPPPYYGPAPGHGGLSPEPSYQYPVTNPGHSGDLFYAPNPYGQPVAVHYSPGPSGSAPEATAHPALVTRSGDSGELRHPPNWPRDYQSVLPSGFIPNQGPSAPPLSSEQYPPPRFGGGIPSARAQPYGPGFDSGYGQTNQATGYEQPQITRRGYFRGPPGGEEYRYNSVDSVPPHRSGLSGQLNGALPSAGEGEPSPGLTGLTGVRDGHLHTAHRASPSDVGRTIGRQQSTENHNGPYEPAGATYERGPVRDLPSYQEFNYAQLAEATNDFSQELGAGGFGTVFLGNFRGTQVAVKRMDPEGLQGPAEFEREAKVLTTLRHRNIVILMGCCPEKFCLVYEYCAQGSLESRLFDDTRPLLWYTRVRIIYEVSLALRWMHELDIIHCDLKLANILLDEHNTAKLGDVGISRVIPSADARTARLTGAQTGTSVQGSHGYVDPALFAGYPQEASSDVYALGVCLLQLLTKRPPGAVRREVTQAYTSQNMLGILDRSAGDWPLAAVVEDLANLAFRCTELYPHDRPNLEDEIIPVLSRLNDLGKAAERRKLDKLHSAEAEADALRAPGARRRDNSDIMETHLFCCPISQEIMEDPVVAADGNTYERSQIETWISVNCTSPVTGLPLANTNLVPNQTLKSAILEWKERNGGQVVDE